ncbi:MAG: nucleotidyltransferase domain-containing protein [Deltaproteobacteria bacterium]|nr:nucleotidyltransferase domain-containing protein [Deltaproteobacteria bacterium]
MKGLTPQETAAVKAFQERVIQLFGKDQIKQCVLFGSRARGEGNEVSDVDLLVLTTEAVVPQRGKIFEIAGDILVEYDIDVSPLVFSERQFQSLRQRERLLAEEIDRDGRPL